MMTVQFTFPNSSAVHTERLRDGVCLDGNAAGTLLYVKGADGRSIAAFPVASVLSATYREGSGLDAPERRPDSSEESSSLPQRAR